MEQTITLFQLDQILQFMFISVDDADGSEVVHDVANALELENCFHVFEEAGRSHQFYDNYYDTTRAVTGFNSRMVCLFTNQFVVITTSLPLQRLKSHPQFAHKT